VEGGCRRRLAAHHLGEPAPRGRLVDVAGAGGVTRRSWLGRSGVGLRGRTASRAATSQGAVGKRRTSSKTTARGARCTSSAATAPAVAGRAAGRRPPAGGFTPDERTGAVVARSPRRWTAPADPGRAGEEGRTSAGAWALERTFPPSGRFGVWWAMIGAPRFPACCLRAHRGNRVTFVRPDSGSQPVPRRGGPRRGAERGAPP